MENDEMKMSDEAKAVILEGVAEIICTLITLF